MEYLLTFFGFILLIGSGNYLVKSSVSFARHLGISTLVIGVTLVAFGTSAPELLVSLQAVLAGSPDMALGNVVGSNISNITLVLALTVIILPISVNKNTVLLDGPVMVGVAILLGLFLLNDSLVFLEGLIFMLILGGFIWLVLKRSRGKSVEQESVPEYAIWLSVLILVISSAGLALGARLLVVNVSKIALSLGVSERAIAISLLALGTSLPELVTSVIAAFQKQTDISVGNIIGSNIFNILAVLGISSMVKPIRVEPVMRIDIAVMIAVSLLLMGMILPLRNPKITRLEGFILLAVYCGYLIFVFNG